MADRHLVDVHAADRVAADVLLAQRRSIHAYRESVSFRVRGWSTQAIPEGAPA